MEPRLDRYALFIAKEYFAGFLKPEEYSLEDLRPELRAKIENGQFKRIVFTGMGCSAIVSDIIRGYFAEIGSPIEVFVVNDYEFPFLLPPSIIDDESTLIIISSYSGHSQEPVRAFDALRHADDRILLLTSGGKLAEVGRERGVSIAYWRLAEPDREYPLFHVTQYFAILLHLFDRLGLLEGNGEEILSRLPEVLSGDVLVAQREQARQIAEASREANIVMLGSPKWHESLLKLAKMHFNEMAMAPATRNYFHEFCHSEVATFSDPTRRHSVLLFADGEEDEYTQKKMDNLVRLLSADIPQNRNVTVHKIDARGNGFLEKYFWALNLVQLITLDLGRFYDVQSRDLISEAAGNAWYHSTTITAEESV
ncbi:SIS domain-containing protein [Streptacidiphilus sp. P02-A3a]|uniref:SIS domain-containing protein n=1 Tax=Streptacidiphilus sp. P02-A3a TaxID=2704468 RepID=UPI0015FD0D02|nr:SIS domain-containing protein [Streptacidiphilus sp. P02-A3a]QMU69981.1 SIS domain-containing protein [Streptacidiphilus sp. P02-A3a]